MKIAVIGATGMVGSRTVAEAASRGHQVDAYSRKGTAVEGASSSQALDLSDAQAARAVIDAHDATVVTVVNRGDAQANVENHRGLIQAAPTGRFIVVGGAGGLQADENTLLKDTPDFPAEIYAEANSFVDVLNLYRASEGLVWTVLAPAPVLQPGERTGQYKTELDVPAGMTVSAEDFAVALVDEAESGAHRNQRFTVAN